MRKATKLVTTAAVNVTLAIVFLRRNNEEDKPVNEISSVDITVSSP
jgi:hypothetical protein